MDNETIWTTPWAVGNVNNSSGGQLGVDAEEELVFIFDRPEIRILFITLYTIVFCSCFFGNLMVILVVTLHWRMRSITNFCLANLAIADFCVSVFCIYQNLSLYLIQNWVLGNFLCKMYHFIDRLSHTASILILVVIAIERYLAIIWPMQCKRILTLNRLRAVIISVWLISALINSPRLYYFHTISHDLGGEEEIICGPDRTLFDSKTSDIFALIVLYLIPLLLISVLYSKIAVVLWRTSQNKCAYSGVEYSSNTDSGGGPGGPPTTGTGNGNIRSRSGLNPHCPSPKRSESLDSEPEISSSEHKISTSEPIVVLKFEKKKRGSSRKGQRGACTLVMNEGVLNGSVQYHKSPDSPNGVLRHDSSDSPGPSPNNLTRELRFDLVPEGHRAVRRASSDSVLPSPSVMVNGHGGVEVSSSSTLPTPRLRRMRVLRGSKYGSRALQSRRRIIRMLIAIVAVFAICNFPFHCRKMWQYFGRGKFLGGSNYSTMLTVLSTLIMYSNSALNPLLYALGSSKFRSSFSELICRVGMSKGRTSKRNLNSFRGRVSEGNVLGNTTH